MDLASSSSKNRGAPTRAQMIAAIHEHVEVVKSLIRNTVEYPMEEDEV